MLQLGREVKDIVYMTALAVVDAQENEKRNRQLEIESPAPVLR